MSDPATDWRPSASVLLLRRRAQLLSRAREFFAARGLLEVETPALVGAPVTDVNLQSARVQLDDSTALWLHTSPEYAMKRLLAAGSGDIWQLCRVVRGAERGRLHNPEFTMIEWYRTGFTLAMLIEEVAALCSALAGARAVKQLRYAAAFRAATGLDPLSCSDASLRELAATLQLPAVTLAALSRDELLDLLMGLRVGPQLGQGCFTFITHYPASQAALARLDAHDARVALRFELYADGMELANGFDELADATQQRQRFEADNRERKRRGLAPRALDERLLAALAAGLPACAGVAVGFDRLVMLATGRKSINEVIAFPTERA